MPKKSSSPKLKVVKHANIWKDMTVADLLEEYKKVGFSGKELAKAHDVMKAMLEEFSLQHFHHHRDWVPSFAGDGRHLRQPPLFCRNRPQIGC